MKMIYLFVFMIVSNLVYGLEISSSLNKKLEKCYSETEYSKGLDIISSIETPNTNIYKNKGVYKDSKNLYMWKIIFMYKNGVNALSMLSDFQYYKKIGGEINTAILNEINEKICSSYIINFNKKMYSFKTNEKDIKDMENLMIEVFHINLDTLSSPNYRDYKKYLSIKNLNIDIDNFENVNVEQTYDAALLYVKNLKYKGNNVAKISKALTTPFKSEELKIFAIISFIVHNIEYDYILKRNIEGSFGWGTTIPSEILLYKKTVCAGYTNIFNELCKYSDIKSGSIYGDNHSFNWVLINDKYNVLDATWLDCEYRENLYLLNKNIVINMIMVEICKETSYNEKLKYINNIKNTNNYIYKEGLKRNSNIDSLFVDLYSYTEFKLEKDTIKIANFVRKYYNMNIQTFNMINNFYYPKNYDLNKYLSIEHHYPIRIDMSSNYNESYDYDSKIGYITKYGIFKSYEEMQSYFSKIKKNNIRMIFSEYK